MGIFDVFKRSDDELTCPECGRPMMPSSINGGWVCDDCNIIVPDDNIDDESLSVWEAADIWASNGKDEDYMFGYSYEELEDALNS